MHQQHFDDIGGFRESGDAGEKENGYTLAEGDDEWYKQHGCEAVKICAGKGDLICMFLGRHCTIIKLTSSMGLEDGSLECFACWRTDQICHIRVLLS